MAPDLSITFDSEDPMPDVRSGVLHPTFDVATVRKRMGSAAAGRTDEDLRRVLDRLGLLGDGGEREPRVDQAQRIAKAAAHQLGAEHPKARKLAFAATLVKDAAELRILFEHYQELRSPEALNQLLQSALEHDREYGHLVPPDMRMGPTSPGKMRELYVQRVNSVDRAQEDEEAREILMLLAGAMLGES